MFDNEFVQSLSFRLSHREGFDSELARLRPRHDSLLDSDGGLLIGEKYTYFEAHAGLWLLVACDRESSHREIDRHPFGEEVVTPAFNRALHQHTNEMS